MEVENKRMCIWCGEWMGETWWRLAHPTECPYFKVFCERNTGVRQVDCMESKENGNS